MTSHCRVLMMPILPFSNKTKRKDAHENQAGCLFLPELLISQLHDSVSVILGITTAFLQQALSLVSRETRTLYPVSAMTRFLSWCVRTIHNPPAVVLLLSGIIQQVQESTCDGTQLQSAGDTHWSSSCSSSLWHLDLNYLFLACVSRFNITFFTGRQRN